MMKDKVGAYCREFRMKKLKLRLQDVEGSENIKTLSAFEHGRTKNMEHLFKYVTACNDKQQKLEFLNGLIKVIEGGNDD